MKSTVDAYFAVGVDVGMEHLGPELQERRLVGVISLEFHLQPESPSFPHSVQGPLYYGFPLVQVVVMRLGIYPLALAFP